jgi:hypothetical protein
MKPEPSAPSPIDDNLLDEIAAEADADRRSGTRRLAGLPVRGRAGRRIDLVLARRAEANAIEAAEPEDKAAEP